MEEEERTDEKKRMMVEGDIKKRNMSRAPQNLNQADTSGMKKTSSSFARLLAKKKQPA